MRQGVSENIGDKFQELTKYRPDESFGDGISWCHEPDFYKKYPEVERISLPEIKAINEISLFNTLRERRSIRKYSDQPMIISDLSYLLWAATGIQRKEEETHRTAPSAGALYPIETYIIVNNVVELKSGVYHYDIENHSLEFIREGDFRQDTTNAALEQDSCANAAVVFAFSAIFQRSKWKYRQRAYRYIYLEAGHIAENLGLAVTSLGLGGCHIAAIFDDLMDKILQLDGLQESVLYIMPVGKI